MLDRRAQERSVMLDFSQFGKPTDNCFVMAFDGRF